MSRLSLPEGVIPPVLTPLTVEQQVDVPALRQLLLKLIDAGIPALFVGGTVGLGSILTTDEYKRLVSTALEVAPDGYPVLCGVLESSTARAVEKTRMLEALGASAFVTVTPFYSRATEHEQLLRHFGALRDATDMEMVVYNIPACTGVEIPQATLFEMARRGWTHNCKDSSGDDAYFQAICRGGAEYGLRVYQGMYPDFAALADIGAVGCVPVPGNIYPELFLNAWANRTNAAAIPDIQKQCDAIWTELVRGTDYLSRSVKLLAEQGIGTGTLPLPFE